MELEESIKIAVEGCGVRLYDTTTAREHDNNIFRIYISSPDGISLDKCAEVSRMVSPLLDVNEPMNGKYKLEVSSPGIERKLKTLNHFIGSVGENVKIKEYSMEIVKGELVQADEDGTLTIKDMQGDTQTVKFDDVLSASTTFKWKK
ncbi:MAG: ribosome maturation factor RimP [Arcobacteraceae bacterium]|nr:ribosome maturation factor RimP [Arcobacteraceae bacterium]